MENQKTKVNKERFSIKLMIISLLLVMFSFAISPSSITAQTPDTRFCSKIDEVIALMFGYKNCEDMKKKIGTVPKPTANPETTTPVPFPTVSPPAGNLPPDNSIAQRAIDMTDLIIASCGAVVTQANMNQGCLNVLRELFTDATIYEMTSCPGRSGSVWLQCVCYARALAKATGKSYDGFGNAKTHINKSVGGYQYQQKIGPSLLPPSPGDLALWNSGPYGHIALIASVYRNYQGAGCDYTMRIVEANYGQNGLVRHDRLLNCDEPSFVGWQKRL